MNKQLLTQKLDILRENNVITEQAYTITQQTFDYMVEKYNRSELTHSDMFLTHACMALTRIKSGEVVEAPADIIMKEVNQSPYKLEIEQIVEYVEGLFDSKLPKEERDFFYIHLHQVLDQNK